MTSFRIVRPAIRLFAAWLSIALAGLAWPLGASAVDFSKSIGATYTDVSLGSMPYRLFLPDGYDAPGADYPLVLFLHGAGERGSDNTSQCNGHMENLFQATQGAFGSQYKAFLLAPQVAGSNQWVDWSWGSGSYSNAQEPAESRSMQLAMQILDQVMAGYNVDSSRIYVTGLSMGGYGTWDAVRRRPDVFAAAAPLSGGGNKDQGALLATVPIWAYHGAADGTVPVSGTDDMYNAVTAAGGSMDYTRPAGVGHSGWGTFYDNSTYRNSANQTFDEWMFSQSKSVVGMLTWNVPGGGSWNGAGNWATGTVPQSAGQVAAFAGSIAANSVVSVDSPVTVGTLRLNNTAASYTIAGPAAITLQATQGNAAVQDFSGLHTVSSPLVLATNASVSVLRAADTLTLSGGVSESVAGRGLTTLGPGIVRLTAASTYTGPTSVSAGTLRVENTSGSATGSAAVSVASGATLAGTGIVSGAVANSGTLAPGGIATPGTLHLPGGLTLNGGGTIRVRLGAAASDAIDLGGTGLLAASGVTVLSLSDAGLTGEGDFPLLANYASGSTFALSNLYLPAKSVGYFASLANDAAARTVSIHLEANNSKLWVGASEPAASRQSTSDAHDFGRVMKNSIHTTRIALHSSGTHALLTNAAMTASGAGIVTDANPIVNFGGASTVGVALSTSSTGARTGQVTVANAATSSHGLGLGSDNGPAQIALSGTVLDNRVVSTPTVDFGAVHLGAAAARTFTLATASGDDQHATRVRVGNAGPDANGLGVSGGGNPLFDNNAVTDQRTLSGTFPAVGAVNAMIILPTTGEGLTGEAPVSVPVRYLAQVYSGRAAWKTGSGTWGAYNNWKDTAAGGLVGGAPGIAGFAGDTAAFDDSLAAPSATIALDGASPRLASLDFNSASGGQYRIERGAGAGAITLDNGPLTATISVSGGMQTIAAPVVLAGNASVTVSRPDDLLTINGGISGGKSLTLAGAGTLALGGANDLSAATVASGTLQLGDGTLGGDLACDIVNHDRLAFNRGDAWTYGGAISGAGQVSQIGSGTTRLTGASSYAGPTQVDWGTLLLDGTLSDGGGGISVRGILGGRGATTRPVDVQSDGTVAPGDDAIGTLHVGPTVFEPLSTLAVKLGPAGQSDCLDIAGTLDLSNDWDVLELTRLGGAFDGHGYTLLRFNAGSLNGQFDFITLDGFPVDANSLSFGGTRYQLAYQTNPAGGGELDLTPVPEPSTIALLAGAGLGLLAAAWRRAGRRGPG